MLQLGLNYFGNLCFHLFHSEILHWFIFRIDYALQRHHELCRNHKRQRITWRDNFWCVSYFCDPRRYAAIVHINVSYSGIIDPQGYSVVVVLRSWLEADMHRPQAILCSPLWLSMPQRTTGLGCDENFRAKSTLWSWCRPKFHVWSLIKSGKSKMHSLSPRWLLLFWKIHTWWNQKQAANTSSYFFIVPLTNVALAFLPPH